MLTPYAGHNSRLSSLNILGNQISEEQANNLVQLLDASDTLKTLCGFSGTETALDLSKRGLSASCAILVANEIKLNSTLRTLNVANNNLGPAGVKRIAEGIKEHP